MPAVAEKVAEPKQPKPAIEYGKTYSAYKVELFPTEEQIFKINQVFEASRYAYNLYLALNKYLYLEKKISDGQKLNNNVKNNEQKFYDDFLMRDDQKLIYQIAKQLYPTDTYLGAFSMGKINTLFKKQAGAQNPLNQQAVAETVSRAAFAHLDSAYQAFWRNLKVDPKRAGQPRFKSFFGPKSAGYTIGVKTKPFSRIYNSETKEATTMITVPKIGKIRCHSKRKIPSVIVKTLSISLSNTGRYFLSASVQYDNQIKYNSIQPTKVVGIDVNVKKDAYLVLNNGQTLNLDYEKLAKAQAYAEQQDKKLARRRNRYDKEYAIYAHNLKQQGKSELIEPKNYDDVRGCREAAKTKAKAHRRVADIRRYEIDLITTELTRKYNFIAIEKLSVSKMKSKYSAINKATANSGFSILMTLLKQKANKYHCQIIEVDPKYTSTICSHCDENCNRLELTPEQWLRMDEWVCPNCGHLNLMHVNAAKNILKLGLTKSKEFDDKSIRQLVEQSSAK